MTCSSASVDRDSTSYGIYDLDPRRFGIVNADPAPAYGWNLWFPGANRKMKFAINAPVLTQVVTLRCAIVLKSISVSLKLAPPRKPL